MANYTTIFRLFLLGMVLFDCTWVFWRTLFPVPTDEEKLRFDYAYTALRDAKRHVLPLLLRNGGLFYLITTASIPVLYKTTATAFFTVETVFFSLALVLGCLHLPIARVPHPKFRWAYAGFSTVWLMLGLATSVGLLITLYQTGPLPAIPDWKVALLANGLVFLFVLLVKIPGEPLLLNELKAIRRRLLLGKLSPVAAAKQIDLVMHGLALRDVLQPYIGRVLKLNNELVTLLEALQIDFDALMKITAEPLLSFDRTTKATIEALLISVDHKTNNILRVKEQLSSAKFALVKQVTLIKTMSPEAAKEIELILEELKQSEERAGRAIEGLEIKLKEIRKTIGEKDIK